MPASKAVLIEAKRKHLSTKYDKNLSTYIGGGMERHTFE